MNFFDINTIAVEMIGYQISYVELIGTIFGLISVYLASRANILTWATGIVNVSFLFILFYQVQLYADMFLQVYFLIVTLYGWYSWKHKPKKNSITTYPIKARLMMIAIICIATIISGLFFSQIHLYLPQIFKEQAAYPYIDSFVMVLSIIATILLAQKKIETWYLWIMVDIVCIFLFFKKGIVFLGIEYLIFLGIASYGLFNWSRALKYG